MAVLTNAYININAVDLSAYAFSVVPSPNVTMVDNGCMNAAGISTQEPGLEAFSIKCQFRYAIGTGKPHTVLLAAHKTAVAVIFKLNGATTSATNPKCTGTAYCIYDAQPGGQLGGELNVGCTLYFSTAYTWATSD